MCIYIYIERERDIHVYSSSSYTSFPLDELGEHEPGRIEPGRIKRVALSLQNQNYYICWF